MKVLRSLIVWCGIILAFVGCQKEYSVEQGNGGQTISSSWEFKEAANAFKGPIDTAFIDTLSGLQFLSVEGTSANGKETVLLQIIGATLATGTYTKGQALFSYISNGTTTLYETDLSGDFSIVITRLDSVGVSGTFSGKVIDGSGAAKTITDGKFSASLKGGATPPPTGNGQVVLWASQGCAASATGPLAIKIGGQTGSISSLTATEPACGASGSATFTLPAGNYSWTAYCGATDSVTGTVTVVANSCVKVKCEFSTPQSNCKISKWLEYDAVTGSKEWAYINTYAATGPNVQKFEWYDSSTSKYMAPPFNISYATGKITVDATKNQYFVTGTDGKVTEFHGFSDPAYDTTGRVFVKYTYNTAGQLIKRTEADEATPAVINFIYDYTYTNGNLTKVTVKDGASGILLADVVYQYSLGEVVKNFLSLFPGSYEIMYFQQAINTGTPSSGAKLTQATTTVYLPTQSSSVTTFTNYVIDATTRQVKSFDVSGKDFGVLGLYSGYRYKLEYKCF